MGGFLVTAPKHLTFLFTEVFLSLLIHSIAMEERIKTRKRTEEKRKEHKPSSAQIVLRDKGKNGQSRKESKWREKMKIIMKKREIKKNEQKGRNKIVTPSQVKPSLAQQVFIIKTVPAPNAGSWESAFGLQTGTQQVQRPRRLNL